MHPRGAHRTREGVFNTRSPDRPNPLGLHRVQITTRASKRPMSLSTRTLTLDFI